MMNPVYDLIICGTGFASTFFLLRFRENNPKARVLVLERGPHDNHFDAVAARRSVGLETTSTFTKTGFGHKDWPFSIALGGSSNCWWGQTPRLWPEDFELLSRFGVGFDWPINYSQLEPYYHRAEGLIVVSGNATMPYPRNGPCPQEPFKLSKVDLALQNIVGPDMWVAAPTARSPLGTNSRGKCCANGVCGLCPVDAKFRIMNELAWVYDKDPNLELLLGCEVRAVIVEAGVAKGVHWVEGNQSHEARSDLVFLGMNGLVNPAVLLASGDDSPLTGRRLHEQASIKLTVDLSSVQDFDGGTHITGLGYMYYGGEQRRQRASCLIEHYNAPPDIRVENGKWLNRAIFKIVAENIPEDRNRVTFDGNRPVAHFEAHTKYALRALNEVREEFLDVLSRMDGIEDVRTEPLARSEGHIQGTTVMAKSQDDGVINANLSHYRIGNLLIGGSGAFPSGPPTNPSLTIAALSLHAADQL